MPLLTELPIPPKPSSFTPEGAPPGVAVDFNAFKWDDGTPWWLHRPLIVPTTQVVHTNGASGEGSLQSQVNWANSGIRSNTHPHYSLNQPQPTKFVPTNRRAIGNSSLYDVERAAGVQDCSYWSIVIESADAGWKNGVPVDGVGDFLHDHAEICARICAYESIVWNIPLWYPDLWYKPGSITHTEPFPYPYFTIKQGKICPGPAKKHTFRTQVLPRARQIRAAWLGGDQDDMYVPLPTPWRFDSRDFGNKVGVGQVLTLDPPAVPVGAKAVHANITFTATEGRFGFIQSWPEGKRPTNPETSILNPTNMIPGGCNAVTLDVADNGSFRLYSNIRTHLIVDVFGYYS